MEAAFTIGSSLTGGLVGRLGGTLGGMAAKRPGSTARRKAQMAAETAEEGARKFTSRDALEAIGRVFDKRSCPGSGRRRP
jgi:hypothetical protein